MPIFMFYLFPERRREGTLIESEMIGFNHSDCDSGTQLAIGNRLNAMPFQRLLRIRRSQNFQFSLPRSAQASADAAERGVVVSRVADKFPGSFRDASADAGE